MILKTVGSCREVSWMLVESAALDGLGSSSPAIPTFPSKFNIFETLSSIFEVNYERRTTP